MVGTGHPDGDVLRAAALDGGRALANRIGTAQQGDHHHGDPTVSWSTHLHQPDFWDRTLQNWQSEFLAIGAMAIFAVFLRQRGSPESKPVGAPHSETPQ